MSYLKKDIFHLTRKKKYINYPYFRVENTTKFIPKLSKESKILLKKN